MNKTKVPSPPWKFILQQERQTATTHMQLAKLLSDKEKNNAKTEMQRVRGGR